MKRLVIALVLAAGIIGVETYLLLKPLPPFPSPIATAPAVVATVPPPRAVPAVQPKPKTHRKPARATPQAADSPRLRELTKGSNQPFVMPTGGIFSGMDPQDPRIYHFNVE